MASTCIVLSGGGPAPARPLPVHDLVIAADSGLHLASELGLVVDLIVGDLDSADPDAVQAAVDSGAVVERHDPDKDASDLDLAMTAAIDRGASRIVVVGGDAGRLDHLLGIATLLAAARWSAVDVEWITSHALATPVRGRRSITTTAGDLISLLPMTPEITVSISGTKWSLDVERLEFGSTRGLSNVAAGPEVVVDVTEGTALLLKVVER